jgi:hypothetical protein
MFLGFIFGKNKRSRIFSYAKDPKFAPKFATHIPVYKEILESLFKYARNGTITACSRRESLSVIEDDSEEKKVNVYLPSLMMKVPNHLYVLGDTYTCHT